MHYQETATIRARLRLVAKPQPNETRLSTIGSTKNSSAGGNDQQTLAVFKAFRLAYGNVWTVQISTTRSRREMFAYWGNGLADLTPEQIRHGLKHLPEQPPSLPAFRNLCRGASSVTQAHKRFPKSKPYRPNRELGLRYLAEIKAGLKHKQPITPPKVR